MNNEGVDILDGDDDNDFKDMFMLEVEIDLGLICCEFKTLNNEEQLRVLNVVIML